MKENKLLNITILTEQVGVVYAPDLYAEGA
jgi:hypothetical protein